MNEQFNENEPLGTLMKSIQEIIDMDENLFEEEEAVNTMLNLIQQQFSPIAVEAAVNQTIAGFEAQGSTKTEVNDAVAALTDYLTHRVYDDKTFSDNKKKVVDAIINPLFEMFNLAAEKYHSYAIELPIQLEEGAQVPTYAHDSDAAADMYAMEDAEIPAHSNGTPVKTGVHIQLPEGWVAFILPRSSIGAKTPLRLSNSAGVIDSGYRGEVRALYDNISNESYQIHKGDRIAQMLVMPSYRFKAIVVDSLEDSDRGEAGFGSTGV